MAWSKPVVTEVCVGMEVTSYESADFPIDQIDPLYNK
jgi:coenzyme PQQ precursor peptide PqqA